MENDTPDYIQYHHELISEIFRKKEEFHRHQAQLPIEEKIKILIELQKIALIIRPKQGEDDLRRVWELD